MKIEHCRTCWFCEPTGKGRKGDKEIDVGVCHGDTPSLTTEAAGAFAPVALDIDWCRHHPDFKLPTRKGKPR